MQDKVSEKDLEELLKPSTNLYASTTRSSGDVLTLDKLNSAVDYLQSEEYEEKVRREQEFIIKGQEIIGRALQQGIINEEEFFKLHMTISINGGLIVSPDMYARLSKVKLNDDK